MILQFFYLLLFSIFGYLFFYILYDLSDPEFSKIKNKKDKLAYAFKNQFMVGVFFIIFGLLENISWIGLFVSIIIWIFS